MKSRSSGEMGIRLIRDLVVPDGTIRISYRASRGWAQRDTAGLAGQQHPTVTRAAVCCRRADRIGPSRGSGCRQAPANGS